MVNFVRRLCAVLLAALALSVANAQTIHALDRGVVATPRNFPNPSDADVRGMFETAKQVGSVVGIMVDWGTPNCQTIARILVDLARAQGLMPVLVLNPFVDKGGAWRVAPPSGTDGNSFANQSVRDAFVRDAAALASLRVPYFALGTDVNRVAISDIDEYLQFASAYKEAATKVKNVAPSTKVFVSFQWEILAELRAREPAKLQEHRKLVEVFRPKLDVLAIGSLPGARAKNPNDLPSTYYAGLADFGREDEKMLLQAGWSAQGAKGAEMQRAFASRLPEIADKAGLNTVIWIMLHDLADRGPAAGFGLAQRDGVQRPAFAAFASGSNLAAAAASASSKSRPSRAGSDEREDDHFSIMISALDGSGLKRIASDRDREINHARVSPNGEWVTFTRYNREGPDGTSMEIHGYDQTEIMLMRIDGSDMRVLVPARPGAIAANGYWMPDGKSIIYVALDPGGEPELRIVDITTGDTRKQPTPPGITPSDPHVVGDLMVFPAKGPDVDTIWMSRVDGSEARQITFPSTWSGAAPGAPGPGDFDPKLSPDGRKVAVMRQVAKDEWHIVIVDLTDGSERSLTKPGEVDAVPEWSSDGRLLIFWHVDLNNLKKTGLWTMRPDGSTRRQVSLPRGFFYTMPAFFPDEGSGSDARIIFSAKRDPKL